MVHAQQARYLRARGEDPDPSVRKAEEIAKRGLKQWGEDPDFLGLRGSVYVTRAGFNVDHGRDPGLPVTS